MGQANRRGTFEQRKQQAIERNNKQHAELVVESAKRSIHTTPKQALVALAVASCYANNTHPH